MKGKSLDQKLSVPIQALASTADARGKQDSALMLASTALSVLPTPRRIDLATLEQVRSEMARVYRDSRCGKLDSQEASRFTYILSQVGKMIELAVLEKRIERLEGVQDANIA